MAAPAAVSVDDPAEFIVFTSARQNACSSPLKRRNTARGKGLMRCGLQSLSERQPWNDRNVWRVSGEIGKSPGQK